MTCAACDYPVHRWLCALQPACPSTPTQMDATAGCMARPSEAPTLGRVRELTASRRFVDSGVNRESPKPHPARLSATQMDGFLFPDSGHSADSGFIPEIVTPESTQV